MKKCTHSIKSILMPLGLTAGSSAANAAIQKRFSGLGRATLATSRKEVKDIIK